MHLHYHLLRTNVYRVFTELFAFVIHFFSSHYIIKIQTSRFIKERFFVFLRSIVCSFIVKLLKYIAHPVRKSHKKVLLPSNLTILFSFKKMTVYFLWSSARFQRYRRIFGGARTVEVLPVWRTFYRSNSSWKVRGPPSRAGSPFPRGFPLPHPPFADFGRRENKKNVQPAPTFWARSFCASVAILLPRGRLQEDSFRPRASNRGTFRSPHKKGRYSVAQLQRRDDLQTPSFFNVLVLAKLRSSPRHNN